MSNNNGNNNAGVGTTTGAGTRGDVCLKLPQLQNLCKRDPAGYRTDYDAQCRRLTAELQLLRLQPEGGGGNHSSRTSHNCVELIQFAAAVASSSYRGAEADRVAQQLMNCLSSSSSSESGADPVIIATAGGETTTTTNNGISSSGSSTIPKDVRRACVSALILMRNKGAVQPLQLFVPFFRLLTASGGGAAAAAGGGGDKALRELLHRHLVNDLRNVNARGRRDDRVNRAAQTFLHRTVQQSASNASSKNFDADDTAHETAAKRAVDMVCELYRRRVWTDERTVAILESAARSPHLSVCTRAVRFFLNIEERMAHDAAREREDGASAVTVDYHRHSKKTCRRARQTQRALRQKKRAVQKRDSGEQWLEGGEHPDRDRGVEAARKLYPALELLRDPQGLAEHAFARLRGRSHGLKFESKMLLINFVTRLAGNHELLLPPLYPFLQKYLGGHQRDVTAVLAYTVQACHGQVPPEHVHGLLQTVAHNFITERCSEEQMAVGINTARAICARVPAVLLGNDGSSNNDGDDNNNNNNNDNDLNATAVAMDMEAFARDLAAYAKHRDRSVATAGKAWTNFVREHHPALLQSKDRGMRGAALKRAGVRPAAYGAQPVASGVAGADLLAEYEQKKKKAAAAKNSERNRNDDDDDENPASDNNEGEEEGDDVSGEWQDVEGGSDEEEQDDEAPQLVLLEDGKPAAQPKVDDDDDDGGGYKNDDDNAADAEPTINLSKMTVEERERLKQEVSSTRVFSTADFVKMRKLVEREERAKRDPREAARRKRAIARGEEFEALSDDEVESLGGGSDDEDDALHVHGAVNPSDIMALASRKRQSKADKLEKILAGRSKFEAKQREGGSTNIEKNRKKNFLMSKFSKDARRKGRGKGGLQKKKREMSMSGTHEAKKRRRKL